MKNLSLTWKIAITFILTGCSLIAFYVHTVNSTYTNIKVQEAEKTHLGSLREVKAGFERQIQNSYFVARNIIALFDSSTGQLSSSGESLFLNESQLVYLMLENESISQTIFILNKLKTPLPSFPHQQEKVLPSAALLTYSLNDTQFLVTKRYQDPTTQNIYALKIIVDIKNIPFLKDHAGTVAILQQGKIVLSSGPKVQWPAHLFMNPSKENMQTLHIHGRDYLFASIPLTSTGLQLVSWLPRTTALSPLRDLITKSAIFIIMSLTLFSFISMLVTGRLSQRLQALTQATKKLKEARFTHTHTVTPHDELDHLSNALSDFSAGFKNTIEMIEETAIRDNETKASQRVYEQLLPKTPSLTVNEISLFGATVVCGSGGAWWHYFTKGNDLFVVLCESDLRGSEAAMLISSTRTTFSMLEKEELSLPQIVYIWDETLRACFQQDTQITGTIARINTTTGTGEYLGIGQGSNFLIQPQRSGFIAQPLRERSDLCIGQGLLDFFEPERFTLDPNSSLLIQTTGRWDSQQEVGELFHSVPSQHEAITFRGEFSRTAQEVTASALTALEAPFQNSHLKKDHIVISIKRNGPRIQSYLESEQGDRFLLTTEAEF